MLESRLRASSPEPGGLEVDDARDARVDAGDVEGAAGLRRDTE